AADSRALAGALTAAGDRAARGPDRRADDRTDRAVLHDFHRLVLRAGLTRRVLVACCDRALARRRRYARDARGRGLGHLRLRLLLLRGAVTARPVRDDQTRHEGSHHHHRHGDRRQFPWIHRMLPLRPYASALPRVDAASPDCVPLPARAALPRPGTTRAPSGDPASPPWRRRTVEESLRREMPRPCSASRAMRAVRTRPGGGRSGHLRTRLRGQRKSSTRARPPGLFTRVVNRRLIGHRRPSITPIWV